jgi:hypothetical protein
VVSETIPTQTTNKYSNKDLKNIHTNSADDVGGKSNFSLEECRRYAESLHEHGINNPGGFARTIFRSGEADDEIERFLHPKQKEKVQPANDIRECPDCQGTGYWYPEGKHQGVKKCTHPRLLNESVSDDDM